MAQTTEILALSFREFHGGIVKIACAIRDLKGIDADLI